MRQAVSLSVDITPDSYLVAFLRLNHVITGIYMCVHLSGNEHRLLILGYNNVSWETVITTGFELDMLRRKRPYKWTIWVSSLQLVKFTTVSMRIAIPWDPLHGLACLYLLTH